MAASDDRLSQKDQFRTCSVCSLCLEPYDEKERQAKCLPCLHTYCSACLESLTDNQPFSCPDCGYLITDGIVDNLPNNFVVDNLREYRDLIYSKLVCGSCEGEDNQAVSVCHDCDHYLCQNCMDKHFESLPEHTISTIGELMRREWFPLTKEPQMYCKRHCKQELGLYCKNTDCSVPICSFCRADDHLNHNVIDLAKATDEVITTIRELSEYVSERNQVVSKKGTTIKELQDNLVEYFNKKERYLIDSEERLVDMIRCRYDGAYSRLKCLYKAEMDALTKTSESVDTLSENMNTACKFANQTCEVAHATQLLTLRNPIIGRLSELRNVAIPEVPSDYETDITFTAKHHEAVATIQEYVPDLCQVQEVDSVLSAKVCAMFFVCVAVGGFLCQHFGKK